MKYILRFFAPIACVFAFASCSGDDPASPGGGYVTPAFHATVETMEGGFNRVFGAGSNDLYAMGRVIMHYDGKHWSSIEPPPGAQDDLQYGRGFPDGSMVVGNGRNTFVRVNNEWRDISDDQNYANDVWGSAPDNLYRFGCCSIRHFDGSSWTSVDVPGVNQGMRAFAGNSSGNIIVGLRDGQVARYDGASWSSTTIDSNITYDDLAMTDSGRTFAATFDEVYDITNNTNKLILRTLITGLRLCVDGEVLYVAGRVIYDPNYFVIARFENGEWSNVAVEKGSIDTFWAGKGGVIVAGWPDYLWRDTGGEGVTEHLFHPVGRIGCVANIDGTLIAAGEEAYRYEQGTWTSLNKAYVSTSMAWDITGLRQNNMYAVGDGMIMHYDGKEWEWVNGGFGLSLNAAWMDKTGDVWVAGSYSTTAMYRLHGQTWSPVESPFKSEYVEDLWGSDDALFAVGTRGSAAVRQNGIWRPIPIRTGQSLISVWGFDDNHVYAASGSDNTLFSWDGRSWHPVEINPATDGRLRSVWGSMPNDLFVAYSDGLLHYDGHTWQPLDRVFTGGGSSVAGANGEVLLLNYYVGTASYRR